MDFEELNNELNLIIFYMDGLETLKKSTQNEHLVDNLKKIYLFEMTIGEIFHRSEELQKKLNREYFNEHKIFQILACLTNSYVTKHSKRSPFLGFYFDEPKYPYVSILKLTDYILFFRKKLKNLTELDIKFLKMNDSVEKLSDFYDKEIKREEEEKGEDYIEMLDDIKKEFIRKSKELSKEDNIEKITKSNKFISDYKYPINTKNSIWTVKK